VSARAGVAVDRGGLTSPLLTTIGRPADVGRPPNAAHVGDRQPATGPLWSPNAAHVGDRQTSPATESSGFRIRAEF
jgi:hypothetical protein